MVENCCTPLTAKEKSLKSDLKAGEKELAAAQAALADREAMLQNAEDNLENLYHQSHVDKRKLQRAAASKAKLRTWIKLLQFVELPSAKGDAAQVIKLLKQEEGHTSELSRQLQKALDNCEMQTGLLKEREHNLGGKLANNLKTTRNLKKRVDQIPQMKANVASKT